MTTGNANMASQQNPVYQGGQFTDIEGLAKSLGAQYDLDSKNGNVSVNGRYVPVVQSVGGQLRGNVYDVARAAGARVEGSPGTGYKVYGASSTSVTGNPTATAQPTDAGQFDPLASIKAMASSGDTAGAAAALSKQWGMSPEQAQANLQSWMAGQPKQAASPGPAASQASPTAQPQAQAPVQAPPQVQLQPFTYQQQPVDYAALLSQASQQAHMWATPQLDSLNRLRSLARGQYDMDVADVRNTLAADIAELRAGEVAREARVNEDMNRRGDAIYNSGIRFAGIRDQQIATQQQEVKLTQRAQNSLSKLASSLNLRLADLSDREASIRAQQGDKAMLTLQQLADKAQTQAFENKKLTWQMWLQGANLTMDQQRMANDLWLNVQRIKSEESRAAEDRALRMAIADGQLEAKYAELAQRTQEAADRNAIEQGKLTMQQVEYLSQTTGYVYGPDGRMLTDSEGNPVRTMAGAKFDWDKQQFIISEGNKVDYQNALLALRQQEAINDAQYREASLEIDRGRLSLENARILETARHNQAMEAQQLAETANADMNRAVSQVQSTWNVSAGAAQVWASLVSQAQQYQLTPEEVGELLNESASLAGDQQSGQWLALMYQRTFLGNAAVGQQLNTYRKGYSE